MKIESNDPAGTPTDVQINGSSITSDGTANIVTEGVYNPSTNKIATMSDISEVVDVKNDRVRWNGLLYKLIPDIHHSQSDWTPDITPAIWVRIDDPAEEYPEWRQPQGSHDAYEEGAKVTHNGKHWINIHGDGNVWEPGIYGWEERE